MRASRLRHLRFESSKKDVYIFLPFLESLLLFKSQSLAPVKIFGVGKGISGTFWIMAAGSWRAWVGRYCCYRLIQARSNGQRGAECGTLDPSCHLGCTVRAFSSRDLDLRRPTQSSPALTWSRRPTLESIR